MSTNLLEEWLTGFSNVSTTLRTMNLRDNPYQESQWNIYRTVGSNVGVYQYQAFNGSSSWLDKAPSFGMNNILDALAFSKWNEGLTKAAGQNSGELGGIGWGSLAPALMTLSGTHIDSLNYDDKWLRTQAGSLVAASNDLRNYVTKDNGDGTYNLDLSSANLGGASALNTTNSYYDWKDDVTRSYNVAGSSVGNFGKVENVKLFSDIDSAYNYARNESSFLYNLKSSALSFLGGVNDPSARTDSVAYSKANIASELNYADANGLNKRRSDVDQYKRNKATSQRLSATAGGAPGIGGSDLEDTLKLGIPNLLGL